MYYYYGQFESRKTNVVLFVSFKLNTYLLYRAFIIIYVCPFLEIFFLGN